MNIDATHLIEKVCKDDLVILGICRNVENDLESDVIKLVDAFRDFKSVHFRLVESDSTDGTLEVLERLSHQIRNFEFVSLGDLESSIPSRVQRIAHCRNVCLDLLTNDQNLAGASYVVVSDFDGVNQLLSAEGVLSCWEKDDWGACTANQGGAYYDIYALRHPTWSPDDCWKFESRLLEQGMDPISAREKAVYSRQIRIPKSSHWIEVDSGFGGLAIYRRGVLKGARYSGMDVYGHEVCEHVTLHEQIRARGFKIFINPKLVNFGWNGHNESRKNRLVIKRYIRLSLYKVIWKLFK